MNLAGILSNFDKFDLWIVIVTIIVTVIILRMKEAPSAILSDHFWQNLDKFLLLFVFIFCACLAVHMIHHNPEDKASISWVQTLVSSVVSALLALLGASKLQSRAADKVNGNGNGNGNGITTTLPTEVPVTSSVLSTPLQVTIKSDKEKV